MDLDGPSSSQHPYDDEPGESEMAPLQPKAPASSNVQADGQRDTEPPTIEYRVYKRRWFGLFQLVLLNIIVSWDVSIFWISTMVLR